MCQLLEAVTPNGTKFDGSFRAISPWMHTAPTELVGLFTLPNGVTMQFESVHIDKKAPFEGVQCVVTVPGRSEALRGCWRGDTFVGAGAAGAKSVLLSTDDGQYEGERNDAGERHGQGKCVYVTGAVYEGQWEHGVRCGQGKYTNFVGDATYTGAFKDDCVHGHAVLTRVNGTTLTGEWAAGAFTSGVYIDLLKNTINVAYSSDFPHAMFCTKDATLVLVDEQLYASIYKGGVVDGLPCMRGTLCVYADLDALCHDTAPHSSQRMAQVREHRFATYTGVWLAGQFVGLGEINIQDTQYESRNSDVNNLQVEISFGEGSIYNGSARFTEFNHIEFLGEGAVEHFEYGRVCEGQWRADDYSTIWGHKMICNGSANILVQDSFLYPVESCHFELVGEKVLATGARSTVKIDDEHGTD